ncbi:hypothetical protein [Aliikangiella sp. IMCC44359]|uniref:hypothetical protein n=1 Tax=Aliikangiella sp. IMCC44359 TaxID=3459125 RepID=UPI00403ABE05
MLRFLIKFLLLVIVLVAITMLTAQWKLEKDVNSFARVIAPFADFKYESARIGLSGEVKLNSISVYIHSLSTSVEIGELRLFVGSLYDLAFFESNVRHNKLPENAHLILQDVLVPFNSSLLRALENNQTPDSFDLLSAAYCGDIDRIGIQEMESMGYDYLAFSSKEFYMLDKYSGSVVLNGSVDIEELLNLEYQVNIGGVLGWIESMEERAIGQNQPDIISPNLSLLELRIKDQGYNLKKAEYCAAKENVSTDEYYAGHEKKVHEMMSKSGIDMKESFKQAYLNFIKPESALLWFIQPKASFDFEGLKYYTFDELRSEVGLRVAVDGEPVTEFFDGWTPENFSDIANKELVQRAEKDPTKSRYKMVTVTRSYQNVIISRAEQYIDFKVRATRDDGMVYEGKLKKTSPKSLWITLRKQKGEVVIPLARTQIVKFEVYKEDRKTEE